MKKNQIESYLKCLLVKTYECHKKSFTRSFNEKGLTRCVKNEHARGR